MNNGYDPYRIGCLFPGECIVAGEHMECECCTVEMMQAFEEEMKQSNVETRETHGAGEVEAN